MGPFSTRKQDDSVEGYTATATNNTVVRVFRSRFYGKSKGKERVSPSLSYMSSEASPSQALPGPSSHSYSPSLPSPLANSMQSNAAAGPSSPRAMPKNESIASSPRKAKRPHPGSPDMLPPPPPKSPTNEHRQRDREKNKDDTPTKSPRKEADSVTVTLAQKLNELAVANSEGLLNDHEYRLLRQNLFERFSSTAAVPAETPVVPVSKPKPRSDISLSSPSRTTPNISQAALPRTPSRTSLSIGVSNILRRATGRSSNTSSKDGSDSASFVSERSTSGFSTITRNLTRKLSISSVKTSTSMAHADSISVTSRWTGTSSDRLCSESVTSLSPTKSAAGSIRQYSTPPSSFRRVGLDSKSIYSGVYDDDRAQTSQEIKQEIITVEAEAKSMMDAFNGLELTALTKLQKKTGRNSVVGPSPEGTNLEPTWTLVANSQSQRMVVDSDSRSIRSATSAGTSASAARSAYSTRQARSTKNLASPGILLRRKGSTSSYNPSGLAGLNHGHMTNNSNLSLPRSAQLNVAEKEVIMIGNEEEVEVEEIRRRREEVMMRYEARLEYLQARLKGAQLHEKLVGK
ncbi:hypothetical protein JOM56_010495 [Amanita muscaria]